MADSRNTGFFDEIKGKVDLADYLTNHLGVELVSSGARGGYEACCPFHVENTPSFKVSESNGEWLAWHCFGACSEGGTVIDAVMKSEGYDDAFEAAAYLNELYGLNLEMNNSGWKAFKENVDSNRRENSSFQSEMEDETSRAAKITRDYLHNRGFDDEAIAYFDLSVDKRSRRLTIPLVDKANHLVGIAKRALFDSAPCKTCGEQVTSDEMRKREFDHRKLTSRGETPGFEWQDCPRCGAKGKEAGIDWVRMQAPKYRFPEAFGADTFLYNQLGARKAMHKERDTTNALYLVEGYADAWAAWQAGQHAICAYNTAMLSEWKASQAVTMALAADKPIVLVPDTDAAGQSNVEKNYQLLRNASKQVVIQVLFGVDDLTYVKNGETRKCKDLGDVLQHHGAEQVATLLKENRWPVEEWLIRYHVTRKNPLGEPLHEKVRQMQLVREVLENVNDQISIDQVVPFLSDAWNLRTEETRTWFYSNLAASDVVSAQHLIKDMWQAEAEALAFQADTANVIPFGYPEIDACLPAGGARKGWLAMALGKSGTGKTMLATALLGNMAAHGVRSIFFSLEQKGGALWERMAQQALDMERDEIERLMSDLWEQIGEELSADNQPDIRKLLEAGCPELAEVNKIYDNLLIVDNVPENAEQSVKMTPGKIQSIIREINMTKFEDRPADVVFVDHLGILEVPEHAPRNVQGDDLQAAGYIMQEMFKVTKATNVLMMVLQQLPKEVKPGVPVDYDSGRGGSKQTDYCDLIFGIWRPEQQIELDDVERQSVAGEYKLRLGKNRHGASVTAHLFFDKRSLRIIPADRVNMPVESFVAAATGNDEGVAIHGGAVRVGGDTSTADPLPRDAEALEAVIAGMGLQEDDRDDEPVEQLASDEALAEFEIS